MSVLDTLTVVFETKGADKVVDATDDVVTVIDDADDSVVEFGKDTVNLSAKLLMVIGPLKAFVAAANMSKAFGETGNDLRLMSQFAGESTESIQLLGNAMKAYGGNAASASAVMGDLNSNLQQMRMGKGGALQDAALLYGFKVSGSGTDGLATSSELIENIAQRMDGLNEQQQLDFGHMLGLDAPTIMMLQGGVQGLHKDMEAAAEMKVFSDRDIDTARKYKMQMIEFTNAVDRMKSAVSRQALPAITSITGALEKSADFFAEYEAITTGIFAAVGIGAAAMAVKALASLGPLVEMLGIGGAFAITGSFAGLAVAITGVSVALSLVIQDFQVWRRGGNSMIGGLVDEIKDVPEQSKKLFGKFKEDVTEALSVLHGKGSSINAGASALMSTKNPLASMDTSIIRMSGKESAKTNQSAGDVTIQTINVNTAATDAAGIAIDVKGAITDEFQKIIFTNYSGAY